MPVTGVLVCKVGYDRPAGTTEQCIIRTYETPVNKIFGEEWYSVYITTDTEPSRCVIDAWEEEIAVIAAETLAKHHGVELDNYIHVVRPAV